MKSIKKRTMVAAISGAIGIVVTTLAMAAPAAQADGLGGVSGWEPTPDICGKQNQIPILVTNVSQVSQTGSITVNDNLAANVQVYDSQAGLGDAPGGGAYGCADTINASQGYSLNFTVQPGTTAVYWAALGGVDSNDYRGSQDIAVGGLPSGTAGASWYDFELSLTGTLGFSAMELQYNNTGGTNMTTNKQNNFNVIPCSTQNGGVQPGAGTLTPYASGYGTGPIYTSGEPVCLAWLPEGDMVQFSNAGASGYTITAAQENVALTSDQMVDFAGTFTGPINSMQYRYQTDYNNALTQTAVVNIPLNSNGSDVDTTATFAFLGGGRWGAVNIPTPPNQYGQVQLFVNGEIFIGSVAFDNS